MKSVCVRASQGVSEGLKREKSEGLMEGSCIDEKDALSDKNGGWGVEE